MRYASLALLTFASFAIAQESTPRATIPQEAAQKAALMLISDVFKPDYANAKTSAQKIELAKKLLGEGVATKDDPVGRFVLMRIARDIAAQQGDLGIALEAIDRICLEFEADRVQMQLDAATTAVRIPKLAKDHQVCAALLMPLIDQAVSADRYENAKSFADLAIACSRNGKDLAGMKQMVAKSKAIAEIAAEFEKAKEAKVVLETRPTEPEANLAVGRFLCFIKGDWERGVTMLALGSNPEFKAAAELELEANPESLKLGDAWWKISEDLAEAAKSRTKAHAGEWYRRALPELSGLTKARVESRLKDIGEGDVSFAKSTNRESEPVTSIVNSLGMKLMLIPAGKFTMGSPMSEADRMREESQVEVVLTKSYYLGQTEVTQHQWKSVMGTEPWKGKGFVKEGEKYPATFVNWEDAVQFCRKLSAKEGKLYRLPTEAEWEYACRGGTLTMYSFGRDATSLASYAWFDKTALETVNKHAHEVGQKKANPLGLLDMHGNVYEWCQDVYSDKLPGGQDPLVSVGGSLRMLRGGSWNRKASRCRSAVRDWVEFSFRENDLGFRVAQISSK